MGNTANPLFRRAITGGLLGMTITASTLLGAGTAMAQPLVVSDPLAVVDAEPGQEIAVAASTLDSKVRSAVLLAMPLAFEQADRAGAAFEDLPPVVLGTAAEGTSTFLGSDIASAAEPLLTELGLPQDKLDAVSWHFGNLVSIGNAVTVRAQAPEPPPTPQPPPEPPPAPEPPPDTPESPRPPDPDMPPGPRPPEPSPAPEPSPLPRPEAGAPVPVRVSPPDYRLVRGSLPPWEFSRLDEAPRDAARPPHDPDGQRRAPDRVAEAGSARAMPVDESNRVAVPILIASVAIAVFTSALVRLLVRRN